MSSFSRVLELNLGQMKITFDIICLTYPTDDEEEVPVGRRVGLLRSISNTSHVSDSSIGDTTLLPGHDLDGLSSVDPG